MHFGWTIFRPIGMSIVPSAFFVKFVCGDFQLMNNFQPHRNMESFLRALS